jgi:hypothetical protein
MRSQALIEFVEQTVSNLSLDDRGLLSVAGVDAAGAPLGPDIFSTAMLMLEPVASRGVSYAVPSEHLDQSLSDHHPVMLGRLVVRYMEALVTEAETIASS